MAALRYPLALLAFCLLIAPIQAQNQTRYVTGEVQVNLRSGPGLEYRIEKVLASGDTVRVLARSAGWARVSGPDGQEGWLLDRMLVAEPPPAARVADLSRRTEELAAENESMRSELTTLRRNRQDAERAINENRDLRERALALESEAQALRHENERLRGRHSGMKIGAAIMVVGVILGVILPMLRRRHAGSSHWV